MTEAPEWTIQSDLLEATGQPTLEEALRYLGLPSTGAEIVPEAQGWYRAGSETYLYAFRLRSGPRVTRLLLKACVAVGSLSGVDAELDQWLLRRRTLDEHSVSTPGLFYRNRGCILEEFVCYSLSSRISSISGEPRERLLFELGRTSAAIDDLGFAPTSLSDLRSRGHDVVVVDFGEDLGPAYQGSAHAGLALDCAVDLVSKCGASKLDLRALSHGYEVGNLV